MMRVRIPQKVPIIEASDQAGYSELPVRRLLRADKYQAPHRAEFRRGSEKATNRQCSGTSKHVGRAALGARTH
jgi:hypothetical protein